MKYNVHAGHNPDNMKACGAVGILKESTEARKVKNKLIEYLKKYNHTVYDCTVNNGSSASDILTKIVTKCNEHVVDLDISIHFNSGAQDFRGNGKSTGVEVLVYDNGTSKIANRILDNVSHLGFRNRGIKIRKDLYVLKHTKSPAILIECCFVDDKDDCNIYDPDKMAKAIAEGILGISIVDKNTTVGSQIECPFIIQCLDNLNIRSTPNGHILIEDGCRKGTRYTITKVEGTWGYLKSGKGWITINSKYVTRV